MKRRIPLAATSAVAAALMTGLTACSTDAGTDKATTTQDTKPKSSQQDGGGVEDVSVQAAGTDLTTMSTKCHYKSYGGFGVGEIVSRKGKGTDKYNDGYTKKSGRQLELSTGKFHDRSAGRLKKAKKGDRVWVNISHDKGKTWKSCGFKTAGKNDSTITSKKYIHSSGDVKNRYMRACAKTAGTTWCADIGNKKNSNHSDNKTRHWWTD